MEVSFKMLLDSRKNWIRLLLAAFSCALFSGCVSASLDDVGLENSNRPPAPSSSVSSAPLAPPTSAPTVQNSGPLELGSNDASVTDANRVDAVNSANATLPSQVESIASQKATGDLTDFKPGTAPNKEKGVAEIRAKAAATGNSAPNINEAPSRGGQHFTADELKLKKALLRAEAQAAQGVITEAELAQKRAQIIALRKKAGAHYKQAVKQISK